jgi:glycerophosphoryl diester phosphodiesterase
VCGCDFELSLDIRDPAAVPAVIALANQWQAASRLWLVGRCDQAASWKSVDEAVNPVCETRDFSPARLRALREAGLSAVNLPYRSWTTKAVSGVHAAGLLAFGWRADSARRIARLLALGCDGVYSDSLSALEGAGLTRSSARRCSGRQGD